MPSLPPPSSIALSSAASAPHATKLSLLQQPVVQKGLQAFVASANELASNIGWVDTQESVGTSELLQHMQDWAASLVKFVQCSNASAGDPTSRDPELNKLLAYLSAIAFTQEKPAGDAAIFAHLFNKHHKSEAPNLTATSSPDFLQILSSTVTVSDPAKDFPGPDTYCSKSAVSKALYNGLARNLADEERLLSTYESKIKTYGEEEVIKKRRAVANLKGSIAGLALELSDVDPMTVSETLQAVKPEIKISVTAIESLCKQAQSLENLILGISNEATALTASGEDHPQTKTAPTQLCYPDFENGQILTADSDLSTELKKLSEPSYLIKIINTYESLRETLRFALLTAKYPKATTELMQQTLSQAFLAGEEPEIGSKIDALLKSTTREVKESLARHYTSVVCANGRFESVLDNPLNMSLAAWAVSNYVLSNQALRNNSPFLAMLKTSPEVDQNIAKLVEATCKLLDKGDYPKLANLLSDELAARSASRNPIALIGILTVMDSLTRQSPANNELRHQIPELDKVKQIAENLATSCPEIQEYAYGLSAKINKVFRASMTNFYVDPVQEQNLWTAINLYRYYIENPQVLNGKSAVEILRSGILLIGDPGAGKTHLTVCFEAELNVTVFLLSPSAIKPGTSPNMLSAAANVFKDVYAFGKKPCMLFIDEAEAICRERRDPDITPEQRELTNYVLQEIDELRKNYPNVFIVAATNYGSEIDRAMRRPGRFDFKITIPKPNSAIREKIILNTLSKIQPAVTLSDPELASLVELTNGLMPLSLIRPINEMERLLIPMGTVGEISFENLQAAYQREVEDLKREQARDLSSGSSRATRIHRRTIHQPTKRRPNA